MSSTKSIDTPRTKLINGDCIEVLQRVSDASIDLTVTDPPYLVNYSSRDGRRIANDNSCGWLRPAFAQVARVLKPNHFCISFYGWNQADRFLHAWKSAGLYPVGHLVWAKSYSSSRRGFLRSTHECAYLLAKGRPARPKVRLNDVLPWSYSGNQLHPTQKPLSAIEPLIAAFSEPGDIVLDPFAGSATTGVAAKRLGRSFLGIELDPKYHRIAARRLSQS